MASRSRKGKGGLAGIVSFFVIGACIVGFFNVPSDPQLNQIPDMLKSKSLTVEAWMQNCAPNAIKGDFSRCSLISNVQTGGVTPSNPLPSQPGTGNNNGGNAPAPANSSETNRVLSTLKVADAQKVEYDRDEWNHWISQGSSCWDTRDQVLYDEAVKDASLVLADKSGKTVTDVAKACSVKSGTWNDPYSGNVFTNPKELDVDHMIPLSYAAQHGGQAWDEKKKEEYANNLSNPNHLIAVKASENRSKSDKGPSEWKPSNKDDYCTYATDWVTISANYGLTLTKSDAAALTSMLATCG
jgi:hypothetical protein